MVDQTKDEIAYIQQKNRMKEHEKSKKKEQEVKDKSDLETETKDKIVERINKVGVNGVLKEIHQFFSNPI